MNNSSRRASELTVDEMGTKDTKFLAQRLLAGMKHPDCPTFMLDLEASKLARFLAIRIHYFRSGNR